MPALICWCDAPATYLDGVDPLVSNDATGVLTHNGEPVAARCDDHSTGGWRIDQASIGPVRASTWWGATFAALVDA